MRINLHIPAHLVNFVNDQRGSQSVQTFLIQQIASLKKQNELLSPNYEELNEKSEKQ